MIDLTDTAAESGTTTETPEAINTTSVTTDTADTAKIASVSSAARTEPLAVSKSGLPCLWENGGGLSNTGHAQVIADHNGYPKRPICVRTHGDLACGNHALIPVREGDHIVTAKRYHDKVALTVERITAIDQDTATVVSEQEPICYDAIAAAIAKASDYHCRSAKYIKQNKED